MSANSVMVSVSSARSTRLRLQVAAADGSLDSVSVDVVAVLALGGLVVMPERTGGRASRGLGLL